MKIKNFCFPEDIKEMKKQAPELEKIFVIHV